MAQDAASLEVHKIWREASEKYDYYVVGLNGALCAWIVQSLQIKTLAPSTYIQLLGLALLIVSAIFGMKRIETSVTIHGLTIQKTRAQEHLEERLSRARKEYDELGRDADSRLGTLDHHIHEISDVIAARIRQAKRFYVSRDLLLWVGFVCYAVGRVVALLQ